MGQDTRSEPPASIVALGMHRSGTSLVTRILERMGIFMGWRKDTNDEAGVPTLEIRYEALLEAPEEHIQSLLACTGVAQPETTIPNLVSVFVKGRGQAYLSDPELGEFAEGHRGELARFGY